MNLSETDGNVSAEAEQDGGAHNHQEARYQKVLDGRKQPIRGLWKRNDAYYGRLSIEDPRTGVKKTQRVRLKATTVPEAKAELFKRLDQRKTNTLPNLKEAPKFKDYVKRYLQHYQDLNDAKRPRTMETEKGHLDRWVEHMGDRRLNEITPTVVKQFETKRKQNKRSNRTVNLGVTVLNNVLKMAVEDGWLTKSTLPTANRSALPCQEKKRNLLETSGVEALYRAALTISKNGRQLADLIRLLAYAGSRISESLKLKWNHVDWYAEKLNFPDEEVKTKGRYSRSVDFNSMLKEHLKDMLTRRAPDSEYLFPSPRRGEEDRAAKDFRASFNMAREKAGLTKVSFHDLRHHFISYCVMAGIDYMTIASWAGHKDGGILIGKVYGHVADQHKRKQAARITFGHPSAEEGKNSKGGLTSQS